MVAFRNQLHHNSAVFAFSLLVFDKVPPMFYTMAMQHDNQRCCDISPHQVPPNRKNEQLLTSDLDPSGRTLDSQSKDLCIYIQNRI